MAASARIESVHLPRRQHSPFTQILRRVGFALALVVFVALVVVVERDGYIDGTGETIGFLDALYYASVTVTTTGYGDITAVSDEARLATIVLITPARILFLILVVSTTVEVLTDQSRQLLLTRRWRKTVSNHVVICGFGATGQAAVSDLIDRGVRADEMVVVDSGRDAIDEATRLGIVAIHGDATRTEVLAQAGIERARAVVVVPNRDDTAVLITLTVREMNPDVHIVAGGREQENLHLLRQGGANEVIDATAAIGRMLGLGTYNPAAADVLADLLDAGTGAELAERAPMGPDAAVPPDVTVVAVLREGRRFRADQVDLDALRTDDRLVVLQQSDTSSSSR